jgi:hypothetical protein
MTTFAIGPAEAALAAGDAGALALELAALYPNDPDVARAHEFADFALHLAAPRPSASSKLASYFLAASKACAPRSLARRPRLTTTACGSGSIWT